MPPYSKPQQALGLLVCLVLAFAAATKGAIASVNAGSFYDALERPGWAPPAWLFGPVWTALYTLIGIATWLVWRQAGVADARRAHFLNLNLAQLAVNALWSWLFFAWNQGALAFLEILLLWMLIAATLRAFWQTSPLAGALLLPYLAWVSFAAFLAYATWQMNPERL